MMALRYKTSIWLLVAAATTCGYAAEIPDVTLSGVASGAALKVGFEGTGKRVLPETVYLQGNRTRLEFGGGGDAQGYILRDGSAVWLISDKVKRAWPLRYGSSTRQYVFDAADPCKSLDISCEREGKRNIAGREASGWRFRHAGNHGPDGSDSGTMWIDDQYGLLLGYHAEDLQGRSLDWTVTAVSFERLPPGLFELPDSNRRP
jgi:hypothetical protein